MGMGAVASGETINLFDVHWRYEHRANRICRIKQVYLFRADITDSLSQGENNFILCPATTTYCVSINRIKADMPCGTVSAELP